MGKMPFDGGERPRAFPLGQKIARLDKRLLLGPLSEGRARRVRRSEGPACQGRCATFDDPHPTSAGVTSTPLRAGTTSAPSETGSPHNVWL